MTREEKEGDVINGENDEVEIEYVVAAADERDEVVDEDDDEQEADDDDDDTGESDDDDVHAGVHFSGCPVQSLDDEDDDDDGDEDDDEDEDDDDDDEEDDGEEVCSSSTSTTPTSKYSIQKAKMEETNGIGKRSRDDAEGVQKANKKRKGKGFVLEDIGEQFKVYNEIRQNELIIKKEKLVIERQKEIRKRRQLELEERNLKIQERKLELDERNLEIQERKVQAEIHTHKFDMLQVLLSKTSLTPSEEMFKEKLIMELYH